MKREGNNCGEGRDAQPLPWTIFDHPLRTHRALRPTHKALALTRSHDNGVACCLHCNLDKKMETIKSCNQILSFLIFSLYHREHTTLVEIR